MGKPKFSRKKYETPSHPWQEDRIKEENEFIKKYGLKNKKEVWKAQTRLRNYRQQARGLLAKVGTGDVQSKKESDELILHLSRMNILPAKSTLDDVLALDTESILSRRLETITYLKGLANTPDQARQLIAHGHISINDKKVTIPGYMVSKDEEGNISYIAKSPLNDPMHPARPRGEFSGMQKRKQEKTKEEVKPVPDKTEKTADEDVEDKKPADSEISKEEKPEQKEEEKKEEKTEEDKKEEKPPEPEPSEEKEQKTEEEPAKAEETKPQDETDAEEKNNEKKQVENEEKKEETNKKEAN